MSIFIYPLHVEYAKNINCLLYDSYYLENGIQKRAWFKIQYDYSFKMISDKNYTKEEFEKFMVHKLDNNFLYYKKFKGYNLFEPNIVEGKATYKNVYQVFITDRLLKKQIKMIEKHHNNLVVEEDINYTPSKYQKDKNIFLFQWNKINHSSLYITNVLKFSLDTEPLTPNFKIICYDIETYYNDKIHDDYDKEHNDIIGSISLKINDEKTICLITNLNNLYEDELKELDNENKDWIDEEEFKNKSQKKRKYINDISNNIFEYDNYILKTFKNEKDMINFFVKEYYNNADVVYGYNNIEFDDKCIKTRYLTLNKKELKNNESVMRYDLIQYIKSLPNNFNSYSLKEQLKIHLSEEKINKIDLSYSKINKLFNDYQENQNLETMRELIIYNNRDVEATKKLEDKLSGFNNVLAISTISSVSINEFISTQISSILMKYIYKILPGNKFIHNTNPNNSTFEGAYTEFRQGGETFFKNVYPFDFKSLYPSTIIFYNLSPDTIINKNNIDNYHEDIYTKLTVDDEIYYFFKKEYFKGFLTELMQQLGNTRTNYKFLMKQNYKKYHPLQNAIKLMMNSIYGKLGQKIKGKNTFNISNRQLAETTTKMGRVNIKLLQKLLNGVIPNNELSLNYEKRDNDFIIIKDILTKSKFVYTDTDSVYIALPLQYQPTSEDIEKKYLSKIFKLPLYAEAEDKISNINICKKKNYIYQTEKDNKIHVKGWKRGEINLVKNLHKNIFNDYINIKENKTNEIIEKIIKNRHLEAINKIDTDSILLNDSKISRKEKELIINNYKINNKLNKNQKATPNDNEKVYKICSTNLKKYSMEQKEEIKENAIKELIETLDCKRENLGVIKSLKSSVFYNWILDKKKIQTGERIDTIKLKNYWDNKILNKIQRVNNLSLDMIDRPFELNKLEYKKQINNRILDNIYPQYKF